MEVESTNRNQVESLPLWKKIMFALGQLGWSLAAFGVGNLLVYFYSPPEANGVPIFPSFIFPGLILGIFTVIGIVGAIGRLFDALTNPLIATWSDRSHSKFGRRRFFMLISVIPFALMSVLVFIPLVVPGLPLLTPGNSWLNIAWLFLTTLLFYFFFVMYVTPYTALISELGHNPRERLFISTLISVTWAVGFALGNQVYSFKNLVQHVSGLSGTLSFQMVLGIFAIFSLMLMLLPIIFINEKRYAQSHVSSEKMVQAIKTTLKNQNYVRFISAELFYFICLTIIQIGMVFFVTTLLGLNETLVSTVMLVMFVCSFLFYPFVNILGNRFGKKPLLTIGFLVFAVVFSGCALMGILPINGVVHAYVIVIVASLPIAIFGILPNALVADIAEADGLITGNYKAGIFFGVRTFEMNMGIFLANLIFPSLLTLGKTVANPTGVRWAAIVAAILCMVGLAIFTRYNEKAVIATLAKSEKIAS